MNVKKEILKKLIIAFGIFVSLFVILIVIAGIDDKKHGSDYLKSREFAFEIYNVYKNNNYCNEQLSSIAAEFFLESEHTSKINEIINNKKYLNDIYNSCIETKNELQAIQIPEVIIDSKAKKMNELQQNFIKIYDIWADSAKILEQCTSANGDCKEKYSKNFDKFLKVSYSSSLLYADTNRTYCVMDIILFIPTKLYIITKSFIDDKFLRFVYRIKKY